MGARRMEVVLAANVRAVAFAGAGRNGEPKGDR